MYFVMFLLIAIFAENFMEDIFLIPVDPLYRWLGVQTTYPRYKRTMLFSFAFDLTFAAYAVL